LGNHFLEQNRCCHKINFDWKNPIQDADFGYEADFNKTVLKIKDLWKNKEAGTTKKNFTDDIVAHDLITLKLIL
jgi:alpha-galactosidase